MFTLEKLDCPFGLAYTQLRPSRSPASVNVKFWDKSPLPNKTAAGDEPIALPRERLVTCFKSLSYMVKVLPSLTKICSYGLLYVQRNLPGRENTNEPELDFTLLPLTCCVKLPEADWKSRLKFCKSSIAPACAIPTAPAHKPSKTAVRTMYTACRRFSKNFMCILSWFACL